MLELLTKKTNSENFFEKAKVADLYEKIRELYSIWDVEEERQAYLTNTIQKYGYLPYPHYKTLEELTPSEIIFTFEQILIKEGILKNGKFIDIKNTSILSRNKVRNSNWFKKEGHNIKLISLSALKDGEKTKEAGKFIDWLAQVITLPTGNRNLGIMPATIYLIPFQEREFDCAYLQKSNNVSDKIADEKLKKFLQMDAKAQVQLFIALAQLSGHPVIYDVLPQTARFSSIVLKNPYVARWFDINELISKTEEFLEILTKNLTKKRKFKKEEIVKTFEVYMQILKGSTKKFNATQEKIMDEVKEDLKEYKILASYQMSFKEKQEEILARVVEVIEKIGTPTSIDDTSKQDKITKALIKAGLWSMPGGAWCSAGVPVFDKMHTSKSYPTFKHYNFKGEDVTHFANLDCQTPYYFVYLENGKYNFKVVDFYVDYMKNLQKDYNFDGFRVDHIDHIVDEVSQRGETPISYRTPAMVLGKVNHELKKQVPYFATLAEYMLWDEFYHEYHKQMEFDLLWGNDIVSQSSKTPKQIIQDNEKLEKYNKKQLFSSNLSILKTYNNQDGEFNAIDQYPGQLGEAGALFKWFKYKFIPGGEGANRPTLFVDGDESFTKTGIERIIGCETSMIRGKNWSFFEKFDALNRFCENSSLIINGKASLIEQDEDGFCAWRIKEKGNKESFLVVANYNSPTEKKEVTQKDGSTKKEIVKGSAVHDKTVELNSNETIVSYYEFDLDENQKMVYATKPIINEISGSIDFQILFPSEFKLYKIIEK